MVAVKSNISARNRRSPQVIYTERANKITPLRQRRDRVMMGKVSKNEEALTLAKKSQDETIAVIPIAEPKPMWLRSLMGLQTASSFVTLAIVAAALAIYGGTIYGEAKWSQEYQKLEKLRRYEQQFSVANELLKNEIAELAASPDVGLVPLDSVEPIYLSPAPLRSVPEDTTSKFQAESKSLFDVPLAY